MYPPPNTRFRFCVRVHVWEPATTKDNSNILLHKGKSDMHTATILHTFTTSPNQSTCKFQNNLNELQCVCVWENQQQQRQFKLFSRACAKVTYIQPSVSIHEDLCACMSMRVWEPATTTTKTIQIFPRMRKSDMDTATTLHTKPIN